MRCGRHGDSHRVFPRRLYAGIYDPYSILFRVGAYDAADQSTESYDQSWSRLFFSSPCGHACG